MISKLSFAALSLVGLSSGSVLRRNDTVKGPLQQLRPVQGSGVLKIPVTKVDPSGNFTKRQDVDPLLNVYNGYLIDTQIGTPLQTVQVQIDTGSYELWVDPLCSNSNSPSYCAQFVVYDPDASSTSSDEGESFDFLYGTGEASGEYLIDDIVIGSGSIPQTQFGWATWSTFMNTGIMGIGLGYPWNLDYYGPIDQLYVYGVTASRAFSIDLASIDVADGSVIFGGIDTMKYIGPLYKSPMISAGNSPDGAWRYWIYMTYVGVTLPGTTTSIACTTSTYKQGMFPDSGATLSHFPTNLFNVLIAHFPSAVQQSSGSWTVDCALRNQAGTIDFGFGTKMIRVNFYDWLWEAGGLCYFGAQPSDDTYSLGDTFMRSAYLVYDQDNFNIHLAQAANCGTNIVAIGTGVNAVPSITGGCTSASSSVVPTSTSSSKSSSSIKTTSSVKTTPSVVSTGVSSVKTTSSTKSSTSSKVSTSSSSTVKTTSSKSSSSSSGKTTTTSSTKSSTLSSSSIKPTSSSSSSKFSSKTTSKPTTSTTSSKPSSTTTTTSSKLTTSSTTTSKSSSTTTTTTTTSKIKTPKSTPTSTSKTTTITSASIKAGSNAQSSCSPVTVYSTVTVTGAQAHGTCSSVGQVF